MITGINHITLGVTDLRRSMSFYRDVLGARAAAEWNTGAYLELGPLWLCLTVAPGGARPARDDTHIALDCAAGDFAPLATRIRAGARLWQDNKSEGASVFFLDPDGHPLDLHAGTLADRLAHYHAHPEKGITLYE